MTGRIYRILLLPLLALTLACGPAKESSRVLLLGLDGLDPRVVDLLMSEGKLPHFAKLRQEGAYGKLISQEPLLSPIIWTTIATGKTADQHGIGHFVAVDEATGAELPVTSELRQVKALWNIVSQAEKTVAVVGWWATWPPEEVAGAIVSDHTAYHFLFGEGFTGGSDEEPKTWPPKLIDRVETKLRRPADLTFEELATFVDVSREEFDQPFEFDNDLSHFKWAYATAGSYRDIGLDLWRTEQPDLGMIYIEGTDSTSHLFGHLFRAEGLGGELAEQQQRFGRAVEEMYLFADQLLGEVLDALDEDTTLLVLSDHGFELGALHDDPSRTRDLRRVSERFHNIEGVLYMYGKGIGANLPLDQPSILDITPTVLALLDLPAAADMPGRVLTEAFDDPVAPERIASWETVGEAHQTGERRDASTDQAMLEHLRSLGYLGSSSSPQGDRNMAAIHFQAGRYREAAKMYKTLVGENPEDASLHTSLAGALGALERYDDALVELEKAIELSPLNIEAYHNRAVIYERTGQTAAAIEDYRRALRYQPQYEPSQRALVRLTGSAETRGPATSEEARAQQLAEQASLIARKGNYSEALRLLEEAEQQAPKLALVQQYRSNVAFLMGDLPAAIAALEKGLKLEPDNMLFRENLKRIRAEAEAGSQ